MERKFNEAELTMPIQANTKYGIEGSSFQPINVTFSDDAKKAIDEIIKNKIRTVTFFDNIYDYKQSTIGIKYQSINPVDVCGYIKSIDCDNNTATIVVRFDSEDTTMHNGDNDWFNEYCHLIPRGMAQRIYKKENGMTKEIFDIVSFIGFDIIKYKEDNVKND